MGVSVSRRSLQTVALCCQLGASEIHAATATAAVCSRVPRRIRVHVASVLDLAHGGAATTDTTAKIDTATAAAHKSNYKGGDEGGPAEPQEGTGGLSLLAVLLGVVRAVDDMVGGSVALHTLVLQHGWV